ncbi:MAG: adenylate kinase [Clostridia bacterium]|nr:adenylate kinase [Clostridia bacterium]
MNIVLLGAPGAGKGTQAAKIINDFEITHISTGEIFRKNIKEKTPLGEKAQSYINEGKLVPDSIVIDMMKDRLSQQDCKKGFLLDGFPRTTVQAEALSKAMQIHAVLNLQMDIKTLIYRLSGRRICSGCGNTTHIEFMNGIDDCNCGGRYVQREDDKEETVKNRLKVYEEQTKPLIDYFAKKGILININADRYKDIVYQDIYEALKSLK